MSREQQRSSRSLIASARLHVHEPVFYQIDADTREVRILAVGVKEKNRLLIGGEEFEG